MDSRSYIVYMHIHKDSGLVYVGYTKNRDNPRKRWRNGEGYINCKKFYNYIKKYGWNSFRHIIFCNTNQSNALLIEKALVCFYKRKGLSLNITDGGEHSSSGMLRKHHSEETKRRIGEAGVGRKMTEATNKMLDYYRHLKKGTKLSEESIQRMIQGSKSKKKVNVYNLFGKYIATYESTREASRKLNIDDTHIGDVCNGKRSTTGNYIFRYAESHESTDIIPPYPIYTLIYKGESRRYVSLQEIAKDLNVSLSCVITTLKGIKNNRKGFKILKENE